MDKDLIEYGGKTENFDPRIVIFEGSPRPSPGHLPVLAQGRLHPVGQHGPVVLHPLQEVHC